MLFEMNSKVRLDADFRAEKFRGTDNQISVIRWNARLIASKLHSALIQQIDLEAIKNADRNHQRIDIVKTVLSPPNDAKRQVDLGRSEELHALAKARATSNAQPSTPNVQSDALFASVGLVYES